MSGDDRFPDPFPGQWASSTPQERVDQPHEASPDSVPRSGGTFTEGWSAGSDPRQGGDPHLEQTRVNPPMGAPDSFPQQDPYRSYPYTQQYGQTPYSQGPSGADPYGQQSSWGGDPYGQPDPYGVPRRGDQNDDGSAKGPNRKIIIVALIVTILVAIGAGAFFGMFRSDSAEPTATTTPSASVSTTDASPTSQASTAASTSTAKKTTAEADAQAPTGFVDAPWDWDGMDFGQITAISAQGAGAVITVDRAEFLIGSDATSYYAEHPELEPLDYAVINESTSTLQFLVTEDALLYGQYLLGDGNNVRTVRISMDQLLDRGQDVVSSGQPINVWLFHTSGEDGPVIYLAEQFIP